MWPPHVHGPDTSSATADVFALLCKYWFQVSVEGQSFWERVDVDYIDLRDERHSRVRLGE